MKYLSIFITSCFLFVFACASNPDVIQHGKESGAEVVTESSPKADAGGAENKPDVNIQTDKSVLQDTLTQTDTPNQTDKPTKPDSHQAKCKTDCDCVKMGMVCESGVCKALKRKNNCPQCSNPMCKAGSPCLESNGSIGTCKKKLTCKDDCDCIAKKFGVCYKGYCEPLKRMTLCVPCSSSACKAPNRCMEKDGSIGQCKSSNPNACKNDCDCESKSLGVCENGSCSPMAARASMCPKCDNPKCKTGIQCINKDHSIGTCSSTPRSCKHDCDCEPFGLLCGGGKCLPLRRLSFCKACSAACVKGDPCRIKKGVYGTCGGSSTFACGNKSCVTGKEYCSSVAGGAAPSCAMPGQTSCPAYCSPYGLNCSDGKKRCNCPSSSCTAFPPSCSSCGCLKNKTCGSCQEKNGNIFVSCYAP